VRFIQIGSCDGVTGDPIHEFVIRDGWEGILVEPLSYNFKLLTASYAGVSGINLINKAVSSLPGELRFYRLPKELPGYPSVWRQISSLSEEHFRMSCVSCRIPIPEDYYEDVNTIAMRDLITMLDTVDVLHIDAEGIDCSLVMTLLKDSTVRPQLILFEANFIKNKEDGSYRAFDERGYAECCAMLKSSGYELLREGRDTLAAKAGQVCG
jgi:FkbM family methyltransferase